MLRKGKKKSLWHRRPIAGTIVLGTLAILFLFKILIWHLYCYKIQCWSIFFIKPVSVRNALILEKSSVCCLYLTMRSRRKLKRSLSAVLKSKTTLANLCQPLHCAILTVCFQTLHSVSSILICEFVLEHSNKNHCSKLVLSVSVVFFPFPSKSESEELPCSFEWIFLER